MVFSKVHQHVIRHLKQQDFRRTLYIGPNGLAFPKVTTYRMHSIYDGCLPFENRSIDFLFGQCHGPLPPPFVLQQELLRTCKRGLLTLRSPIAALTYDLPDEEDDERYAVWTETHTNRLCFLPMPFERVCLLDHTRFNGWKQLATINPLFLFNLYEWEHAMELNLKIYPHTLCAEEFQVVLEEACEASVQHTHSWMAMHESTFRDGE